MSSFYPFRQLSEQPLPYDLVDGEDDMGIDSDGDSGGDGSVKGAEKW